MHLFYLNKIPAIEVIYQKAGNLIGPKTKVFQTFSKFLFPAGFGIFSYVEDKSQLRKKEKNLQDCSSKNKYLSSCIICDSVSVELYTCVLLNWSKGACQILFGGFCKLGVVGYPPKPPKVVCQKHCPQMGGGEYPSSPPERCSPKNRYFW